MPDIFTAPPEEPVKEPIEKLPKKKFKFSLEKIPHSWAAFIPQPLNVRFETQEKKEKIVILLRRHPLTNVPWILLAGLMLITPLILLILGFFSLNSMPTNFRLVCFLAWYLLTFAIAFERFLIWFFNVNILTDERVVDINFPTLLYRQIAETKIDKIQNVSCVTGGYLRSLFNYGDVLIQSAEAMPKIIFEAVPHPELVAKIINSLLLEEEQEKLDGRVS
jgi:hypothetical protein